MTVIEGSLVVLIESLFLFVVTSERGACATKLNDEDDVVRTTAKIRLRYFIVFLFVIIDR